MIFEEKDIEEKENNNPDLIDSQKVTEEESEFEVLSQNSDFEEISNTSSLSSSSEFNSLPDEFIPSDDNEIQVNNDLLDDLFQLGPERLIKKLKDSTTPNNALRAFGFQLPPQYEDYPHVWELVKDILLRYIYIRPRQEHIPNTLTAAKELIKQSKRIVIISGAGISVAAGIPDFRSEESGLYAQIRRTFPELPCPEAMFDLHYFLENPRPFFQLCRSLLSDGARPTPTHHFIKNLEESGRLLMNFTQNIDTLEEKAGIERVLYCHGSFSTAHCLRCRHKYTLCQFTSMLINSKDDIVLCEEGDGGVVKPDIVFFGESLSEDFHQVLPKCMEGADLLIVIGSSLKVQPVGTIPDLLSPTIPQMLINMEPILDHNFDIVLLGDCQETVLHLLN